MGHSIHRNAAGDVMASVSAVPNITKDFFKQDLDGYEDWICRQVHGYNKEHCCVKAGRDYYDECADLGTDIHNLREAFLKVESFSEGVPEYQAKVFEPVARFYKESGYKPLFIEEKMTGATFGGTLDGAGTFSVPFWAEQRSTFWDKYSKQYLLETEERPDMRLPTTETVWIEDLKIKSKLDNLHPLQLFGYRLLLQETKGVTADWGLIIRREKNLDKKPELQLRAYYLPAYEELWDAAMKMWHFLND